MQINERAVFDQVYRDLKAEGFYDELAKALNLKPKHKPVPRAARAAVKSKTAKKPAAASEKKKTGVCCRAARLSFGRRVTRGKCVLQAKQSRPQGRFFIAWA